MTTEYRKILLDGYPILAQRDGDRLVTRDGRSIAVDDAVHLPPVDPTKIICVHLNYHSRVDEFITKLPPAPTYFHKPLTALNTHNGDIVRPQRCKWLNYEGEIAIVIGKHCRNVSQAEAGDYIAGYSVANDYGLHDFRDTDAGSMLRVKGSDTLCPVGPGLVEGWDFHGKQIRTYVNGKVVQDDNTDNMEMGYCTISWPISRAPLRWCRAISCYPARRPTAGPCSPGTSSKSRSRVSANSATESSKVPHRYATSVGAQPTESEEVISTAMGGDWEHRGKRAAKGEGAKHYESKLDD